MRRNASLVFRYCLCYNYFVKIAIIDDERLIREGLKIIFSAYPDIEVVGIGSDGNEAFDICKTHAPDLIFLDIRMPNYNGVDATKKIKEQYPNIKILMLTTFTDIDYIQQALKNGASGYLLKDSAPDVIYDGIKAALSGNVVINPEIAQNILLGKAEKREPKTEEEITTLANEYELTQKEIEIIKLVAEGFSNKEIAHKQQLSEGTIKNNISVIFSKTFVADRTQLALFAFKNGIV